MIKMKTLTIGDVTYEVVDAQAREQLAALENVNAGSYIITGTWRDEDVDGFINYQAAFDDNYSWTDLLSAINNNHYISCVLRYHLEGYQDLRLTLTSFDGFSSCYFTGMIGSQYAVELQVTEANGPESMLVFDIPEGEAVYNEIASLAEYVDEVTSNTISYNSQTLTEEQKAQARENIGAAAVGETGASEAIIDVTSLPTEDIDENAFYRLLTGTFVYNQFAQNGWTCYCMEALPETGEPVTLDMVSVTAYYNISDGDVYGYINDMLAAQAGVPVGWYPLSTLAPLFGVAWGGVITDIMDDPADDILRLLLESVVYYYKDEWVSMKTIGTAGTGASAEVFNHPSNKATGEASHAEGYYSHAEGYYSHAEGYYSHTEGDSSHAEGGYSHAEGYSSHAEGYYSHAEGNSSHAEGYSSHAEGYSSHAEGYYSHAEGEASHAEGEASHAEGYYSHAEGYYSHAACRSQHAQGEYNEIDPEYNADTPGMRGKYAHIVGNGTADTARSNAHTLDWNGNAWFSGSIKVGGTGQDDENAVAVLTTADMDDIIAKVLAALPTWEGGSY